MLSFPGYTEKGKQSWKMVQLVLIEGMTMP